MEEMISMKTLYVIEESFPSGETKIIKKVYTLEDVHKTLTTITSNNYLMGDYKINSFAKILHYFTVDNTRHFNVNIIED